MGKPVSGKEFIAEINSLHENLKNARLTKIEIDKSAASITYNFICDKAVSEEEKRDVLKVAEKFTADVFQNVSIRITKIVSNSELINSEIYKYIKENFPSISTFLKPTDVVSVVFGEMVKYVIRTTESDAEYLKNKGGISRINEYLSTRFCSDFVGDTEVKEAEETVSLLSDEVYEAELEKIQHRTIKVTDVEAIDDPFMGDLATYIEDAGLGEVTICGTVTDVQERTAKNGKPFFIFYLDDSTGRTSGIYFSKKNTYLRVKRIAVGDAVIVRGNFSLRDGKKSFTIDKVNACTFPSDFKKKEKYFRSAPKDYTLVFPTPATTIKVASVFDSDSGSLPSELTDKEYVVFDLETTGLEIMNNGITDIGAVRIKGGRIIEQFATLVKPDYPITAENEKITGISEAMVKDAPKISAVMPDFMKFIEGATLVGHNIIMFDLPFIRRFAEAEDYAIKNDVVDTVYLSRELFPSAKRHDLESLAERFDIVFNHHRALADAKATAEAFIEMMKMKYAKK